MTDSKQTPSDEGLASPSKAPSIPYFPETNKNPIVKPKETAATTLSLFHRSSITVVVCKMERCQTKFFLVTPQANALQTNTNTIIRWRLRVNVITLGRMIHAALHCAKISLSSAA